MLVHPRLAHRERLHTVSDARAVFPLGLSLPSVHLHTPSRWYRSRGFQRQVARRVAGLLDIPLLLCFSVPPAGRTWCPRADHLRDPQVPTGVGGEGQVHV